MCRYVLDFTSILANFFPFALEEVWRLIRQLGFRLHLETR